MNSKVAVLMTTYNGEKYIEEQLESIEKQSYDDITIFIRDDGSLDNTVEILEKIRSKYNNIEIYKGENLGPCKSFFEIIKKSPDTYDYYAFSDQDDFWLRFKIENAVNKLKKFKKIDKPVLYFTDTILVDKNLKKINQLRVIKKEDVKPENAIVENLATGCTVVINKNLKKLLEKISFEDMRIGMMHDDFAYKICALTGNIIFDDQSNILYRQHENNVVGSADTLKTQILKRIKSIRKNLGLRKEYSKIILKNFNELIKPEYKNLLNGYAKYNFNRIKLVFNFNIGRVKKIDDLLYRISLILNIF